MPDAPLCPYCGAAAVFTATSAHLYTGRNYGPVWECSPCAAWVGCHKGGTKPLGRLADKALRQAKQRAHAAFDPIWQEKMKRTGCRRGEARGKGYRWMAQQLGISQADCHIGMFDVEMCERVVAICTPVKERLAA